MRRSQTGLSKVLVIYSWHCSKKSISHTSKTAVWASKYHSIQCERVPFEVMGKVSDYRQTQTDWLTDCPTDQCVHTSHLLVAGNTEYFPVLRTAAINFLYWLTELWSTWGSIRGRQSPFRRGKIVHWLRLCLSNRESCRLFKVASVTL